MKLDLDELAQYCEDLVIEDSYLDKRDGYNHVPLNIGGYRDGEYCGVGTIDYVSTGRGEKLVKLLKALPELIAIAQVKYDNDAEAMWRGD